MVTRAGLRPLLCWLLPTVLTGFAVSYQASRPELWRDELATWSAARRPVSEIVALGQHIDAASVPYYVVVHFSMGLLGDSPLALRLPSLVAMTATALVTALLARRLLGPGPALLAGLLVAAMPVVSRYAQEARGYAFAALFATLATLLLVKAVEQGRWWRWCAYGTCVVLLGLAHVIALLILAGHLVIARRRLVAWIPTAAVAVAALTPLLLLGLDQRGKQLDWLHRATPTTLANIPDYLFLSGIIGGAILALAAVGGSPLLLTAVLPILGLYAIDQLVTPMFVPRYLLFVVPLLCALAAHGLSRVSLPLALVAVLVLALIGLPKQAEIRREHSGVDYRAAATLLRAHAQPGDAIVYADRAGWQLPDTAMHYYNGDNLPRDLLLAATAEQNNSLWPTECPDPAPCLAPATRLWTLSPDSLTTGRRASPTDQLTSAEQALLTSAFEETARYRVPGITLALFTRR
ncbi:glycosyltransferase family 39 protein [Winogradskya humida]|uniref:Glycosyltransferase RgtA/B/C/D-like domain-containing protein n=1 Tax=Winogradskya humida TaxID=113566 RepID=A0ABQ3ZVX6_9ACTN|nr:glycosyltransferase family 39 protein [Actinoplanes humidus]GIE22723.1 hypothetical protein Ahu01nite_058250 [Actinoplanes humidus]